MSQPTQVTPASASLAASRLRNADSSRTLAWLPAEALQIDLADPAQRRFGDYELIERIGEGGMGVVYRARQHGLERDVAIKLLAAGPGATPAFVERFRREARSAARMQHPNIVEIYEFGRRGELDFFSMRLIEGRSLAQRIAAEGPLPAKDAARLLRTLAEAVDYAHRLGVLHLDLKPANVLLDARGTPLIADFGLARHIDATHEGSEVSGTPSYMAPEQARGEHATTATDLYGLGAILHECLAGRAPFIGIDAQAVLERVVGEPPSGLPRAVPADLAAICRKCLEKNPAERYASARALADELGRFLDDAPVAARPLNPAQRLRRWVHRKPAEAALLVTLAAGLVMTAQQMTQAQQARALAERRRAEAVALQARSEAHAERGRQLVELMAAVFPSLEVIDAESERSTEQAGLRLMDWMQARLPGKDEEQGEILEEFVRALDAADKTRAALVLLDPLTQRLGADYRRRSADALVSRGTARDLARAAAFMQFDSATAQDREHQRAWLRRAVELAPTDADVVAAAALYCAMPQCGDFDPQGRLVRIEPENAYAWLIAAQGSKDTTIVDGFLRQAAGATRFDDHLPLVMRLLDEAAATSGVPIPQALVRPTQALVGKARAERFIVQSQFFGAPQFDHNLFVDACVERHLRATDPLHEACLNFGRLAARSGRSVQAQMAGVAIVRMLAPGTAEAESLRELRRRYVYAIQARMGMNPAQIRRMMDEAHYVDDFLANNQLEALRRDLVRAGIAPDPPAGWMPDDPLRLMTEPEREQYLKTHPEAARPAAR